MEHLLSAKFKVGADASAAAGPVGREAGGDTDWKMRAEVLTYSRARGVFAGITLNGAVLVQDTDDTQALYGKQLSFKTILTGEVPAPAGTSPFVEEVARYFHAAKMHEKAEARPDTRDAAGAETAELHPARLTEAPSDSLAQDSQQAPYGSTGAKTTKLSSEQVKNNIESALQNTRGLSTGNVRVSVSEDTVTLSGSVPSERDKAVIDRIAMENASGREVDDKGLNVK
jgi:osmotically-inducible protein OsmY